MTVPAEPPPAPQGDYAGMYWRGEITPTQPPDTTAVTWEDIVRMYQRMYEQMTPEIPVRHADCPVHETRGYLLPEDLREALDRIERATTPIVCHPDDAERMETAVRQLPYAGLLPVRPSSLVPPGTAYVISQDALTVPPIGRIFTDVKMTTNEP